MLQNTLLNSLVLYARFKPRIIHLWLVTVIYAQRRNYGRERTTAPLWFRCLYVKFVEKQLLVKAFGGTSINLRVPRMPAPPLTPRLMLHPNLGQHGRPCHKRRHASQMQKNRRKRESQKASYAAYLAGEAAKLRANYTSKEILSSKKLKKFGVYQRVKGWEYRRRKKITKTVTQIEDKAK